MELEELEKEHASKPKPRAVVPACGPLHFAPYSRQLPSVQSKGALDQMEEWEHYIQHGFSAFHRLYSGD